MFLSYCFLHCHANLVTFFIPVFPCLDLQIVHLKRFQFHNGRWVKSQKIVKFPQSNFDPTQYVVPREKSQSLTVEGESSLCIGNSMSERNSVSRDINRESPPHTPKANGKVVPGEKPRLNGSAGKPSVTAGDEKLNGQISTSDDDSLNEDYSNIKYNLYAMSVSTDRFF